VVIRQVGLGPDESAIVGNRAGYLSLALELLKAGVCDAPGCEKQSRHLTTNLNKVLSEDSDVSFHDLMLDDSGNLRQKVRDSFKMQFNPLDAALIGVLGVIALCCALVGAVHIFGDLAGIIR
jgi:hypothetical protein